MLSEKLFEDILVKYSELIEDGLTFVGRQVTYFGKRIDILLEDRFREKLIVELKIGNLERNALSQVMEYEGYILSEKDPSARVMIIANRIPLNLKKAMDHHGIECKEITHKHLMEFLEQRDVILLNEIMGQKQEEPQIITTKRKSKYAIQISEGSVTDELTEIEKKRLTFFSQFLPICNQKTNLFSKISPPKYQNWICTGTGISGTLWGVEIWKQKSRVSFGFSSPSIELNKIRFESIFAHKNEIENICGESLEWHFKNDQIQRGIRSNSRLGGMDDEDKWSDIQKDLVDRLIKLERSLKPYILKFYNISTL